MRGDTAWLVAQGGTLRLRAFDGGEVVEVTLLPPGRRRLPAIDRVSFALAAPPRPAPLALSRGQRLEIDAGKLRVAVHRNPLRLELRRSDGSLVYVDDARGHGWSGGEVRTWKVLPSSLRCYGLGQKSGHLEKRGNAYVMWNTDRGYYWGDDDPLYQSIPFLLGHDAERGQSFGLLLDNTHRSFFDLGLSARDRWSFGAEGGALRYYVLAGPTPKAVVEQHTRLVGRMPLPPRWALGYHQARYSYYPARRVRELAARFRRERIPCDAIHLDIHHMDRYRSFTWDPKRFADPKGLVAELGRSGIKVVAIVDPGLAAISGYRPHDEALAGGHVVRWPDGSVYRGRVWPGACVFPDFVRPATRRWWGGQLAPLVEAGVAGIWTDMNEPAIFDGPSKTMPLELRHGGGPISGSHRRYHNVYGMLMSRATYEGLQRLRPGHRPFVLTRATFAGGHRWAASWTGDNAATWQHLSFAVPMALNMGLSGQAFSGPDVGGFFGAPTPELMSRFLQLGAWMPLFRTHTNIDTPDQEPWSHGAPYTAINRQAIELRYRFLPYLYTLFHQAARRGWPVVRPLFFEFPADRASLREDRQLLVGNAVMVAPVTRAAVRRRRVRFPPGSAWFDLHSRRRYSDERVEVPTPLERIGVFLRAGAVIPSQPVVQHTGERPGRLELIVLPSPEPVDSMVYQDRGDGPPTGPRRVVRYRQRASAAALTVEVTPAGTLAPPERYDLFRVWAVGRPPSAVSWRGRPVPRVRDLDAVSIGWRHDRGLREVQVKVPPPRTTSRLRLVY